MLVGFSGYGLGSVADAFRYLLDQNRSKAREENPPQVLRGDPDQMIRVCTSNRHKHKYSSGVLSFAPGENITDAMKNDIMDRFENAAFAGLDSDQYEITWVLHEHAGHTELHFVVARMELHSGKALNIRPPGSEATALFDAFRRQINLEYGLADPDDPARARDTKMSNVVERDIARVERGEGALLSSTEMKRNIMEFCRQQVGTENSMTFDELKAAIKEEFNCEIVKEGSTKDGDFYISIKHPDQKRNMRFKGELFDADFYTDGRREVFVAEYMSDHGQTLQSDHGQINAHIDKAENDAALERLVEARRQYNQDRYRKDEGDLPDPEPEDLPPAPEHYDLQDSLLREVSNQPFEEWLDDYNFESDGASPVGPSRRLIDSCRSVIASSGEAINDWLSWLEDWRSVGHRNDDHQPLRDRVRDRIRGAVDDAVTAGDEWMAGFVGYTNEVFGEDNLAVVGQQDSGATIRTDGGDRREGLRGLFSNRIVRGVKEGLGTIGDKLRNIFTDIASKRSEEPSAKPDPSNAWDLGLPELETESRKGFETASGQDTEQREPFDGAGAAASAYREIRSKHRSTNEFDSDADRQIEQLNRMIKGLEIAVNTYQPPKPELKIQDLPLDQMLSDMDMLSNTHAPKPMFDQIKEASAEYQAKKQSKPKPPTPPEPDPDDGFDPGMGM